MDAQLLPYVTTSFFSWSCGKDRNFKDSSGMDVFYTYTPIGVGGYRSDTDVLTRDCEPLHPQPESNGAA